MSITAASFPWQRGALSVQHNHCAVMPLFPLKPSLKDLSLLYGIFTLTPLPQVNIWHTIFWSVRLWRVAKEEIPCAVIASMCTQRGGLWKYWLTPQIWTIGSELYHALHEFRRDIHAVKSQEYVKCSASNPTWSRWKISDVSPLGPVGLAFVWWPSLFFLHLSLLSAVKWKIRENPRPFIH